jgi:hypothetical protein
MMIRWRLVAYICLFVAGKEYGQKYYILSALLLGFSLVSFWFYDHGSLSDKEDRS